MAPVRLLDFNPFTSSFSSKDHTSQFSDHHVSEEEKHGKNARRTNDLSITVMPAPVPVTPAITIQSSTPTSAFPLLLAENNDGSDDIDNIDDSSDVNSIRHNPWVEPLTLSIRSVTMAVEPIGVASRDVSCAT